MKETILKLTDSRSPQIVIGRTGEHDVARIILDISHYIDLYGDVSASVVVSESVYKTGYPIPCTQDGATVTIPVTDALTRRSVSYMEVRMSTGDGLAKSEMVKVICANALPDATGEAPTPIADWIERAEKVLKDLQESGVDPEIIEKSLRDYLAENPIEVDTLTEKEVKQIVESYGYLTEDHDTIYDDTEIRNLLNEKADKSEIPSTEGLASEEWVQEQGYITADDVPSGGVEDVKVSGVSIVEDGVANIPVSKGDFSVGLIKLRGNYGFQYSETQGYFIADPSNSSLINRDSARVLKCANIDQAVRLAMTDGKGIAWTEDEQKAARERMGIYPMSEEGY